MTNEQMLTVLVIVMIIIASSTTIVIYLLVKNLFEHKLDALRHEWEEARHEGIVRGLLRELEKKARGAEFIPRQSLSAGTALIEWKGTDVKVLVTYPQNLFDRGKLSALNLYGRPMFEFPLSRMKEFVRVLVAEVEKRRDTRAVSRSRIIEPPEKK